MTKKWCRLDGLNCFIEVKKYMNYPNHYAMVTYTACSNLKQCASGLNTEFTKQD